jgi:predicted ATPase
MARLDRLGHAKGVAQIGAAIGREFSHALLAPVTHKPAPTATAIATPPWCWSPTGMAYVLSSW